MREHPEAGLAVGRLVLLECSKRTGQVTPLLRRPGALAPSHLRDEAMVVPPTAEEKKTLEGPGGPGRW